jgi:hypothetical protein
VDNSGGNQANVQASLAGRYATALFDLAREAKAIDAVEASLAKVQKEALAESSEICLAHDQCARSRAMRGSFCCSGDRQVDEARCADRERRSACLQRTAVLAKPLRDHRGRLARLLRRIAVKSPQMSPARMLVGCSR